MNARRLGVLASGCAAVVRASGALLVVSAALKLLDRGAVGGALVHYGLPQALAAPATILLCAVELGVGAWALARPRGAAPAIMLLYTAFAGWHLAMAAFMGDDGDCPCMGLSMFGKTGPQAALAPALLLAAASAFVLAWATRRPAR